MERFDWDPLKDRPLGPKAGESRRRYLLRRIGVAVVTLIGVTIVAFLLFQVFGGADYLSARLRGLG